MSNYNYTTKSPKKVIQINENTNCLGHVSVLTGFCQACFLTFRGGTDSSGCHAGSQPYHCHDEDDNGCAIAGPEDTNGSITLNLFLIGLNVFSPPDS